MTKKTIKLLLLGILLGLITVGIAWAIDGAVINTEINECNQWAKQAETIPDFYLTDWQKQQCDHYHVPIKTVAADGLVNGLPCGNAWSCDPEVNALEGWSTAEERDYYKGLLTYTPKWAPGPVEQTGKASWYNYSLKGKPGYSKTHATAASRDYKRGTKLNVCTYPAKTLETRCVEVVVNDYGPKAGTGKVIDLSSYAFKKLYPLSKGVGGVIINPVHINRP